MMKEKWAGSSRKTSSECCAPPQRQHLLVHTARTRGYSKLLLGESCSRLAVRLLTCVSLGRGAHLAQDTVGVSADSLMAPPPLLGLKAVCGLQGFSDCRFGDVTLVRPMREFSAKEIAVYNHMFGVPTVIIPTLDTKVRPPTTTPLQREQIPSVHKCVHARFLVNFFSFRGRWRRATPPALL